MRAVGLLLLGIILPLLAATAPAAGDTVLPGTEIRKTKFSFQDLRNRLDAAIEKNKVYVVSRASASAGAKHRGIEIPGNMVVGVYRNDFAVRMLAASVAAGVEAPLRFYLTENADGTATLSYRKPSAVFGPYGSKPLDELAKELDVLWAKIAADTVGR